MLLTQLWNLSETLVFESLSYHENMHLLQSDEFVNNNKIGEIFDERLQD